MHIILKSIFVVGAMLTLYSNATVQAANMSPTVTKPINSNVIQAHGHGHGYGYGHGYGHGHWHGYGHVHRGWGWGAPGFGFQLYAPSPGSLYNNGPVCRRECRTDSWGNTRCHRVCY